MGARSQAEVGLTLLLKLTLEQVMVVKELNFVLRCSMEIISGLLGLLKGLTEIMLAKHLTFRLAHVSF